MKCQIVITESAEGDVSEIHSYVEVHDSPECADALLDGIEGVITSLATLSERGHYPPELLRIGIREYRELHFKPYRVIYELRGNDVIIHCVLDGRRDLQTLLYQRLVRCSAFNGLRSTVLRYDDPCEPVGSDEWESEKN